MSTTTLTKPVSSRERARLKKQRQRERQREQKRLAAEAEADRQEAAAEKLAPAVMRTAVMMGDRMLIGPRVQIVNGRPMRALPLGTDTDPIGHSRSSQVTSRHKRAARLLQLDWDDVGAGLCVGAMDYLRSGGGGSGEGGHIAMGEQIAARARLDGALTHLGAFAPSIARTVLDCIPIGVWGDEVGKDLAEATAWIALGLTRLGGFYWPPNPESDRLPVLTFGPKREAYSTDVGDELEGE